MSHLDIGDTLLIRCAHFEDRHLGVLVGKEEGRLLVVYADLPKFALQGLRKHPVVTVRYAHESTLLGFDARLLETPKGEDSLLFLEYPESIQGYDQRRERRLLCNFPARIFTGNSVFPGLVQDISASAVRIALEDADPDRPTFLFTENEELRLDFHVIDPKAAFSFRCRLLREFIASGRRYAVLLLHEQEAALRKQLRKYVEGVYEGPIRPVSR
ncbi:MAG: PilZ domain-containing protein [Desulfovibrio sp.]